MKAFESELIDQHFDEYLVALNRLMQVESVEGPCEVGAPFGPGPKRALEVMLEIARDWGFEVEMVDNAVGFASWANHSDSNDYVGVLGHLDVVAAGSGWNYLPFALTIAGKQAFGRGVLDNKGPTLASLFAAKLLKDSGKVYTKNLRVIFGTNEESGSADLAYYLAKYPAPRLGFTPDSQFPAVYAEKGVVSVELQTSFSRGALAGLSAIEGDFVASSIPDQATFVLSDGTRHRFAGKRTPSNEPQLGLNAITLGASQLNHQPLFSSELQAYLTWLAERLHQQHAGEGLVGATSEMDLQLSPHTLAIRDDQLILSLSIRYSIDYQEEQILSLLQSNLPRLTTQVEITRSFSPIAFDRSHPMLEIMRHSYESVTGLDGSPIITTGATYARFMPNIIAFGPSFPGQIGIAHNHNEYMFVDDLKRNIEIYRLTLDDLLNSELDQA